MDDPGRERLAVALEAVLQVRQLSEIRHMIDMRLGEYSDTTRWRVVTATNELVTNAIVHADGCAGLRIYLSPDTIHVEVDDLSDVRPRLHGDRTSGLGIVDLTVQRWGVRARPDRTVRNDPDDASLGKTVWCELRAS